MARQSTYYLARVSKLGTLTSESLAGLIANGAPHQELAFSYSFVDVVPGEVVINSTTFRFVFGRLAKYRPDGTVPVIDPDAGLRREQPEPNLEVARSQFVYVPAYELVAYEHVWNHIEFGRFPKLFQSIVEARAGEFFASCELNVIADIRSFVVAISEMVEIDRIRANVRPPNPLFGDLWKDLRDYLTRRRASQLRVDERSTGKSGLDTNISRTIAAVASSDTNTSSTNAPRQPLELADAAVAMAADGYGEASVEGRTSRGQKTVRTRDSAITFKLPSDAPAISIAEKAIMESAKIGSERNLRH